MRYTITFHMLGLDGHENVVSEHEVTCALLDAYTASPDTTLAAIRLAEPAHRIDGFRVTDEAGRLVLRHSSDDRG